MNMNMVRILMTVTVLSVGLPALALAHSDGNSWEQVFNQYKVDVGYDTASFVVGEPVHFDFNVTREQGGQDVDFADAWVRVTQGETTVFAGGIHKPSIGPAGMTFTFPQAGAYSMNVRFEKTGESLVDATFPMTVNAPAVPKKHFQPLTLVAWAGWPVALCVGAYFVYKRRNKLV